MEITSVTVRKVDKEGSRMRGIASVLLDDSFAVHDIRIIEGENGLLDYRFRYKYTILYTGAF